MALVVNDRVKETTTTTGTGTVNLAGAVTGFETFVAGIGNSNTTYYAIIHRTANEWEVGRGTVTDASPDTLARTAVISSSNSDSAVDFAVGTKDVFVTLPASKSIIKDASGHIIIPDDKKLYFGTGEDTYLEYDEDGTDKLIIKGNTTFLDGAYDFDIASHDGSNGLKLGGTLVTSSAAELNILDGKSFVDEDTMSSDSATAIASQQSIKAYVDTKITAEDLDVTSDSGTIAIDLDSETLTIAGGTGLASSATSNTVTLAVDAAQTGITSLLATDIKIGEDDETKIDFETANEIHFYANNVEQVYLADNIFGPQSDSDVDLGTTGVRWKDAFVDSVVVTDNVTIGGNLTVNGTTTTIATTNTVVKDSLLELNNGASSNSNDSGIVIERGSTGDNAIFMWDESADTFVVGTTTATGADTGNLTVTDAALQAGSLDISGDADIDGTLEADAITVDGTTLAEFISDTAGAMFTSNTETGITVTYQDADNTVDVAIDAAQTTITSLLATDIKIGEDDQTKIDFETADTINFYAGNEKQLVLTDGALTPGTNAIVDLGTDALEFKDAYFDGTVEADAYTVAGTALDTHIAGVTVTNATNSAHVLVTDNESTNEENLITFVEGATDSTGNVGLEMDGHLTYNPSTGTVTATIFKGNIDAVDGDFDGTLEADAITVGGATLSSVIQDEATALAIALG